MKDQLLESDIPEKDLTRVIEALEKAGFKPLLSAEFVRGKQKVIITPTGFNWIDGKYKEFDLTPNELLYYLRK